jgi:hypothetical protein
MCKKYSANFILENIKYKISTFKILQLVIFNKYAKLLSYKIAQKTDKGRVFLLFDII